MSCFLSKPTVVSVTSNKPDGKYRAGTDMNIRVTFSEAVAVSGTPTLKLETGTNDAVISYDRIAENDAKTLIFQYTVAAGHDSRDLNYAGINALVLPGANSTIKSIKNVPADLTLPALDSTASLAGSKAIEIDTAGPVAPARPHVPDQRDVKIFGTSSSTTEPTIVTSGNTIRIRVKDCPAGHKVHIRDGALSSPIETKDCVVAGDVDFTLYTLSPSAKYNLYASFTDAAGNESALSPKQTIIKLALYSVTYVYADSTGGSIPPAQGKIHGTELTLARNVNNLAKDGYSFAGWSTATDGSGTNYAEGGAYALNASLVLYPRWTPIAATYLIRYNANSPTTGTAPADQTKTHDISLTLAAKPSNLEKTGYRFIGWNTLANGSGTKYTAGGAYTSNTATTLFAEWDPNSNKVTFDKNSTTATETMGDQLIETGETTKLNVNQFKNNGFIFAGWNTAANGSGTRYDDRADYTMGTANVRLYAQWTARTAITAIGDIAGTAQVGYTLTAGAVTPAGATVSYQWQRTNAEGDFINIDGETSNTYRIVAGAGDVGKRIRVSVTGTGLYKGTINSDPTVAVIGGPVNGTCGTAVDVYGVNDTSYGTRTFCGLSGSVPTPTNPSFPAAGASITWTCSGINGGNPSGTCTATKNTTALVSITAITGTKKVGSILTAGDINPAGATAGATYQWERAGADGVYTDIGLNSRTYTLVDADKDKFIRVSATGTGNYSGTVTSAATTAITGATVNGTCGTAASAYDSSATSYGASPVFCATGTPPSPAPSFPVVGTPVTWTCAGQNGGASVTTCTATKSKIGLQSVAINGNARVGSALTVSNLLPTGATATYQWKISSTANGTYSNIGT